MLKFRLTEKGRRTLYFPDDITWENPTLLPSEDMFGVELILLKCLNDVEEHGRAFWPEELVPVDTATTAERILLKEGAIERDV